MKLIYKRYISNLVMMQHYKFDQQTMLAMDGDRGQYYIILKLSVTYEWLRSGKHTDREIMSSHE